MFLYSGNDKSSEEGYNTEFRSYPDDAWYSVRVSLEGKGGEELRVNYQNFPDEHDNVFAAENFKSVEELKEFMGRFRQLSAQLQDRECSDVVKGMRVCASDTFKNNDVRFYDAIVEDVVRIKHSYVNGEEECECIFLLSWLHGPNVGNMTYKGVANICLLRRFELEPTLESFMETILQKIEKDSCKSDSCIAVAQHEVNGSPIVKQQPSVAGRLRERKCAQWSLSKVWPSEAIIGEAKVHCENRQDTDLGGDKRNYIILVQNLEKGLSSSTVLDFILKQTSIAPQVYIFPSLPWEPSANGVIVVDSEKDLEQLFGFLKNPEHTVVSSKGRPWVATETTSMNDHRNSMLESPKKSVNRSSGGGFSNELKVVCSGTEEYKRAKERRDLFLQFIDHQKGQYKKLSMEEKSIS